MFSSRQCFDHMGWSFLEHVSIGIGCSILDHVLLGSIMECLVLDHVLFEGQWDA